MNIEQVLQRLDKAWTAFEESYAGLPDSQLMIPGVTGSWSVRDIIAHVTWWEEEALKHLPLIREGGSIPITSQFRTILGAETLLLGLALADCRAHSPNENFPLENFEAGIRLNKAVLRELAR